MRSPSYSSRRDDGSHAKGILKVIIPLAALAVVGGGIYLKVAKFESGKPAVTLAPDAKFLGPEIAVRAEDARSGLAELTVEAVQGQATIPLLSERFVPPVPSIDRKIPLRPLPKGLGEGEATIRVTAKDRSWNGGNTAVLEVKRAIDNRPPHPAILGGPHYINQGGCGYVEFTTNEDVPVAGLKVGDMAFTAYKVGPNRYGVLFPLPAGTPATTIFRATAEDAAGNKGEAEFKPNIKPKAFRTDRVELTDKFLGNVIPYFKEMDSSLTGSDLDIFLKMNRDQRDVDAQKIREVCANTAPTRLWSGAFLRLPDSSPMASYAQARTYFYKSQEVDRQTHMGVDLASLQNSPVPAANAGKVVFAEALGIYGNTVMVDHGCGLFTMYSHLSAFQVEPGKEVAKGDILGRTGSTGMAGGDHLHFAMICQGMFVNPVEWWDEHWINDNITIKTF